MSTTPPAHAGSAAQSAADVRTVARVADQASSAKLKVRFAPAYLSFLPMVWILARRSDLTKDDLADAFAAARDNGPSTEARNATRP